MKSALLTNNVRNAYVWTFLGNGVKQLLTFGLSMMLARFLTPTDYGLIGMVLVITTFLTSIQNLGISGALIYFNDGEEALPTYYTSTAVMGVLLTAVLFLGAPYVAAFYDKPELIMIVRLLSFTLFMQGIRSVSIARAMRGFRFPQLTIGESICGITAAVVAVIMAANGMGVWSLVTNLLLSTFLYTIVVFWLVPPTLKLHIDSAVLRRALRWGLPQTGSGLLWKFYDSSDYLIIGKFLGASSLGIYTIAFRLATLVNEKVSAIVSRVGFTTFAALKGKPEAPAHWLSLTQKVAAVNFGMLALLLTMGEDAVLVVLGEKWLPAVAPMRILCFVGATKTLGSVTSSLLAATGRTGLVFMVNLGSSIVMPISFFVAAKLGGIVGVAIAWLILSPFATAYMVYSATRATGIGVRDYLGCLKIPVLVCLACIAASAPTLLFMPLGFSRLVVGTALGGICGTAALLKDPFFRREAQRIGSFIQARFYASA